MASTATTPKTQISLDLVVELSAEEEEKGADLSVE